MCERDAKRAQNLIEHEDEIKSRPKRTWFQTEKQKKAVKGLFFFPFFFILTTIEKASEQFKGEEPLQEPEPKEEPKPKERLVPLIKRVTRRVCFCFVMNWV